MPDITTTDALTADRLRARLHYDPVTGVFVWLESRYRSRIGTEAGWVREDGYIRIRIDGCDYRANRLAWLYMTGQWPTLIVDHEDRDPANNRWKNLREISHKKNLENIDPRGHGATGRVGMSWDKSKGNWMAHLCHNSTPIRLGRFHTLIDAVAARIRAERRYFTHAPACSSSPTTNQGTHDAIRA